MVKNRSTRGKLHAFVLLRLFVLLHLGVSSNVRGRPFYPTFEVEPHGAASLKGIYPGWSNSSLLFQHHTHPYFFGRCLIFIYHQSHTILWHSNTLAAFPPRDLWEQWLIFNWLCTNKHLFWWLIYSDFSVYNNPLGIYYYNSHFTEKESEGQRWGLSKAQNY